jgi:hypothetical protein
MNAIDGMFSWDCAMRRQKLIDLWNTTHLRMPINEGIST